MKLQELTPMLRTKDLQGTVEFYTSILGFECGSLSEEWGWASLSRADSEGSIRVSLVIW
jgi:catechol 2,3-dioxygenase-like lactoylglutathione lyase family enzyme